MTPGPAWRGPEGRRTCWFRTVTDPDRRHGAEKTPAPNLKLIANFGNGPVDNIDVQAAVGARLITVTNQRRGVLTEDTADMTMALILAVAATAHRGRQLC